MSNRRRPLLVPRPGLALPVSRRTFLRGTLGGGACRSPAAGCSPPVAPRGPRQTAESCDSEDLSESEKVVNWSNWPAYIDPISQDDSTLGAFEDMTGISVNYTADVNDNLQFYAKVADQLGDCEAIGRDIITLTDWMAARMIDLGWVQKLDHANLPNVQANLIENLRAVVGPRARVQRAVAERA